MAKYTVIIASRVDQQLIKHIQFLANVSIEAARSLRVEYVKVLNRLEDNPYQFPLETDPVLRESGYYKAIFFKKYKAEFLVEDNTVYLDAVVDCRQSTKSIDI